MTDHYRPIDDLDCSILCHLCENSRASSIEIAKKLGVALSTVINHWIFRQCRAQAIRTASLWLSESIRTKHPENPDPALDAIHLIPNTTQIVLSLHIGSDLSDLIRNNPSKR